MYCQFCGEEAHTQARFCWNCGKPVTYFELPHELTASGSDVSRRADTVIREGSRGESAQPDFAAPDSGDRSETDIRHLEVLALGGDAQSQLELGRRCECGDGVPQDYRKAAEWYQHSADQGNPEAQAALADLYENGRGVTRDPRTALRWYLKAAGQAYPGARLRYDNLDAKEGRASAQFAMGLRCEEGQDVCQNMPAAAEWYRLAAAQGYSSAQFRLGMMYADGKGLGRNVEEALRWLTVAAQTRDVRAQCATGHLYETEDRVRDPATAFEWYRRAANQGNTDAQHRLAHMFAQGLGVQRNEKEAAKWQTLAEQRPAIEFDPYGGTDENWHGNPGWGGHRETGAKPKRGGPRRRSMDRGTEKESRLFSVLRRVFYYLTGNVDPK